MSMERYFECVKEILPAGYYKSSSNLKHHLEFVFKDIDLNEKRLLDIGGGWGLMSFYSAFKGAQSPTCVEPETDGSTSGMRDTFLRVKAGLKAEQVNLETLPIQDFNSQEKYDVVLLHNSINHLNEDACKSLLLNPEARLSYSRLFKQIHSLCNVNADIIICDCSRRNFFGDLGIRNPIARGIEWEKHQSPYFWSALLSDNCFTSPKITWNSFNIGGALGKLLLSNGIAAYFLFSHFRLHMKAR